MEFGPEIKVNGVKPEWLGDDDAMEYRHFMDRPEDGMIPAPKHGGWSAGDWKCVTAIRLLADHTCYDQNTPTPDERAVAPAIVERMRKLVEQMANDHYDLPRHTADEARAIVAALEPVDPMLLEARQVVAGLYEGQGVAHLREQALSGEGDEWFHTKVARAALARGRQLEKEGK